MPGIGGPVANVNLRGRNFAIAEDTEANTQLGGDNNEVEMNGDGLTGRLLKTKVAWMVDGLSFSIDSDNEDQEFIQASADLNDFFPITVEYVDGRIRQGVGQITGEISASSKTATAPLTLKGPGLFTLQS